jgi:hypothetical protein
VFSGRFYYAESDKVMKINSEVHRRFMDKKTDIFHEWSFEKSFKELDGKIQKMSRNVLWDMKLCNSVSLNEVL